MVDSHELFYRDEDLRELRKDYSIEFEHKFRNAYKQYIKGNWGKAEILLNQCLEMNPKDGPTITLKNYIESENGMVPINWQGYRELLEK